MRRTLGAVALAGAVLVAICGCTSPGTDNRADIGTPSPAATPSHSAASSPASTPSVPTDPMTLPPDADRGPRPGAEGTVIRNGMGNPVGYVVASGDAPASIAARFGVSVEDLTSRANIGYATIYPGEKLTLIW